MRQVIIQSLGLTTVPWELQLSLPDRHDDAWGVSTHKSLREYRHVVLNLVQYIHQCLLQDGSNHPFPPRPSPIQIICFEHPRGAQTLVRGLCSRNGSLECSWLNIANECWCRGKTNINNNRNNSQASKDTMNEWLDYFPVLIFSSSAGNQWWPSGQETQESPLRKNLRFLGLKASRMSRHPGPGEVIIKLTLISGQAMVHWSYLCSEQGASNECSSG